MTTLAIVGGGIAGRSLLFHLAKSGISFRKITLFSSESFAEACSRNSTAIVAPRGVSRGLSPLGDLLHESFGLFQEHVHVHGPQGVERIRQYTGASTKIDQFQKRYPGGIATTSLGPLRAHREFYLAEEDAYLIDPAVYLNWLLAEAQTLPLETVEDFVKEIRPLAKGVFIGTQDGREEVFDKVVLASGSYNENWREILSPQKVSLSKPTPGAYLEFSSVDLGPISFSLTLNGDNLIYQKSGRLLIGSTTETHRHRLASERGLGDLLERLRASLDVELPQYGEAIVRTGLREKAAKREPYLIQDGSLFGIGGLYKNGYSVNLKLSRDLLGRL